VFFWLSLLLVFSSCACQQTEKIKTKVKAGRFGNFQCTFTIAWVESNVNLKKSKLACSPKKKKAKVKNFPLKTSKGQLTMDFTISPSKIIKAVLDIPNPTTTTTSTTTTSPPLPGSTTNCPLGFTEVCTLPPGESCPEGTESSCPNVDLYVNNIPTTLDCSCISTYILDDAILSEKSPLGFCYDACVCLPSSATSCVPSCSQPPAPEKGEWYCTEKDGDLTCTLECFIGYISGHAGTTVCNEGHWTINPVNMTCKAAVALITSSDSAQIYSPYGLCSQILPNIPVKRTSATLDLVGEVAILCGGTPMDHEASQICLQMNLTTYDWSDHSNPPLSTYLYLAGTYNATRQHHSSLVHQDSLILMGGQWANEDTYEVWNGIEWKSFDTTPFHYIYGSERCTVKVSRDTYIIMGGRISGVDIEKRVLEYNITSQTFTQLPDLQIGRSYHACTLVRNSTYKGILLPGTPSELYDLRTRTSEIVGSLNSSPGGQMMVLGEKIVQLKTDSVEEFDLATRTWTVGPYKLLSSIDTYSQATAIPGPAHQCCDCYA